MINRVNGYASKAMNEGSDTSKSNTFKVKEKVNIINPIVFIICVFFKLKIHKI
jgi:hypothetical protein